MAHLKERCTGTTVATAKLRIIWIGLQDGESDDECDGGVGDIYVEVNNSQDDENAQ